MQSFAPLFEGSADAARAALAALVPNTFLQALVWYTLTAPAILFAVILLAALVLPRSWFWVAWFWQMNNISLMGMTLYMHRRLRRMPEDIWIQDGGTVITVYAPQDIGEMNRE